MDQLKPKSRISLRIQNQLREEYYVYSGIERSFPGVGCVRNKLLLSRSSTESEVISSDAGLRIDGTPALDLWDLVVDVLHSSPKKKNSTGKLVRQRSPRGNTPTPRRRNTSTEMILNYSMWITLPQTQNLLIAALRFKFLKDNEGVIKMIIKGRRPTMRHVSRTHRVGLDWLFDKINVDTKNQFADILPKGNVSCEEWNHFLRLFNISTLYCFLPVI